MFFDKQTLYKQTNNPVSCWRYRNQQQKKTLHTHIHTQTHVAENHQFDVCLNFFVRKSFSWFSETIFFYQNLKFLKSHAMERRHWAVAAMMDASYFWNLFHQQLNINTSLLQPEKRPSFRRILPVYFAQLTKSFLFQKKIIKIIMHFFSSS